MKPVYDRVESGRRLGLRNVKHGLSYRRRGTTYLSWHSMKGRCFNPANNSYRYYGARGITVCERWLSYENFLADMGERPKGKSLSRDDNAGIYEPGNCSWQTPREQALNRSSNKLFEYLGKSLTLGEWSDQTGILRTTIEARLKRGWSISDALTKPVARQKNNTSIFLRGPRQMVLGWAA